MSKAYPTPDALFKLCQCSPVRPYTKGQIESCLNDAGHVPTKRAIEAVARMLFEATIEELSHLPYPATVELVRTSLPDHAHFSPQQLHALTAAINRRARSALPTELKLLYEKLMALPNRPYIREEVMEACRRLCEGRVPLHREISAVWSQLKDWVEKQCLHNLPAPIDKAALVRWLETNRFSLSERSVLLLMTKLNKLDRKRLIICPALVNADRVARVAKKQNVPCPKDLPQVLQKRKYARLLTCTDQAILLALKRVTALPNVALMYVLCATFLADVRQRKLDWQAIANEYASVEVTTIGFLVDSLSAICIAEQFKLPIEDRCDKPIRATIQDRIDPLSWRILMTMDSYVRKHVRRPHEDGAPASGRQIPPFIIARYVFLNVATHALPLSTLVDCYGMDFEALEGLFQNSTLSHFGGEQTYEVKPICAPDS